MKVFFDHQIFLIQRVGGISRYFNSLKKAMIKHKYCAVDTWFLIYRNSYLGPDNGAIYLGNGKVNFINKVLAKRPVFKLLNWLNERVSLFRFGKNDCDIVHLTEIYTDYINTSKFKKPLVVTVHDLIPELFPESFKDAETWLRQRESTFKKADHLICISESTKRDLKNVYGFADSKITMIYHGPPDYLTEKNDFTLFETGMYAGQKYILYVGERFAPYKNFRDMLNNLVPVLKKDPYLKLVCVGPLFSVNEQVYFTELEIASSIIAVQAHDDELFAIYKRSACFILPSLYEGFGFPLLEAIKAGCPVLCSNVSSLPEVGGPYISYFNPVTFDGFKEGLKEILYETRLAEDHQYQANQANHLKKFSWQNTALQTYNVYRNLLG